MRERLYNSKYEIRPRIMLLAMCASGRFFSVEQFLIYDFMAVYAHEFIDGGVNLHGENGFKYSEFSARKQAIEEAVKALVRNGLLQVELNDGFKYSVTDDGEKLFSMMESSYACEYTEQIKSVLEAYSKYSEQELQKLIRRKALRENGEGRKQPCIM